MASFGADGKGASDATAAIQQAIAAAEKNGGVVHFAPGLYRVDGLLTVGASRVVLRGDGKDKSRVHFRKSAGLSFQSHLTLAGKVTAEKDRPLAKDGAPFDVEVALNDVTGLAPGDDVAIGWVISDAFIAEHQMTGTWDHDGNAFAHGWQPFFRRQIVAIAGNTVTLDVPLRYPAKLRDQASLRRESGYLEEVGVEDLGLSDAVDWDAAWAVSQLHLVELRGVKDGWVRGIGSFPSPSAPATGKGAGAHVQSGGLMVSASKRVTVSDSEMHAAENRGDGGNGYLFEVRQSSEILFRDLVASDGRHNFIQNWGFGTSGCVWLRVTSSGSEAWVGKDGPSLAAASELHHSLALANLVDASTFDDGWHAVNRGSESSYAGHSGTLDVMWNTRGKGVLRSRQFGYGYVIGTADVTVQTTLDGVVLDGSGTAPEDYTEGIDEAATLEPPSLYEDQLKRRSAKSPW